MSGKRVVITGLGAVTPIGNSVRELWDSLGNGKSGVRQVRNFTMPNEKPQIAAEVDLPENASQYFKNTKLFKHLDRNIIMGVLAGKQAVLDSGLKIEYEPERTGSIIASGEGGVETVWKMANTMFTRERCSLNPFYLVNIIPNSAAAFFCIENGIRGLSFSVNSACASSNHAIGIAFQFIKSGIADVIFTGGTEAACNALGLLAFSSIYALSRRIGEPERASRPFDRNRDGFVLGEGAAVLCLEELEHARQRGARIYAEIRGVGFSTDAYDLVSPEPEGRGACQAINAALSASELQAGDIDLINCHGTSTFKGDLAENIAINKVFGEDRAASIPAQAPKSLTGHLLGGAGVMQALSSIMTFTRNVIHPTINFEERDPDINLNIVTEPREGSRVRNILANSFGFGGHNACVVYSRFSG